MNRIISYIKQDWALMRQERLFSSIYILGTGLSIMVVMVLATVIYLRVAPIYPETNRNRMLVVMGGSVKLKEGARGMWASDIAPATMEKIFAPSQHLEKLAIFRSETRYLQAEGTLDEEQSVTILHVNADYWTVFPFHFVDGKAFTEADFTSGIATAVIAESLARKLFGTNKAAGQTVVLDFKPYRVCGVVRDASFITWRSFAQVYIPYTAVKGYDDAFGPENLLGNMRAVLLARSADDLDALHADVTENIRRLNLTLPEHNFSLHGQPDRQWQSALRGWASEDTDFTKKIMQYLLVFLLMLLIPAVSLSGMIESRMERRLSELGIRRSFGAPKALLMWQIIAENFVFTLLGGALGLLLSYAVVVFGRSWVISLGQQMVFAPQGDVDILITPSMLLNFPLFIFALVICFLLNLLAALIPAWRASHREIVYSLNAKQ
ncbi:MAG: ABC transporter permease [Tannerella sp.]|nr:ABC transporter permease [Tannerella sp.]